MVKTMHERLKEHLNFLIEHKKILKASEIFYPADCWSVKKLIILQDYIKPYLSILTAKENNKYKYSDAWFYLDLFSGPGASQIKGTKTLVLGSPIISLLKGIFPIKKRDEIVSFTKWFFIEQRQDYVNALKMRIKKTFNKLEEEYGKKIFLNQDVFVLKGDCNAKISKVFDIIGKDHKRISILTFVDTQGFTDIKWSTWETLLEKTFVDLILVYFTSGAKRNVKSIDFDQYLPILEDWKKKKIKRSGISDKELVDILMKGICEKMGRSIKYASLPVLNRKKSEIYKIIWMSHSKGAAKAMKNSIDFADKISIQDISNIFKILQRTQRDLTSFDTK
jgi:three-Cys-motif partner protein